MIAGDYMRSAGDVFSMEALYIAQEENLLFSLAFSFHRHFESRVLISSWHLCPKSKTLWEILKVSLWNLNDFFFFEALCQEVSCYFLCCWSGRGCNRAFLWSNKSLQRQGTGLLIPERKAPCAQVAGKPEAHVCRHIRAASPPGTLAKDVTDELGWKHRKFE